MAAQKSSRSEEVAKVQVRIDGEDFTLRGQASDTYVRELARYVDAKIEQVRRSHPNLPRHRVAVLAAIYLADEVHELKKENGELFELLEEAR